MTREQAIARRQQRMNKSKRRAQVSFLTEEEVRELLWIKEQRRW